MQLIIDDHQMNPQLVARFMDVATYDEGSDIVRLEGHLLHGILSRREMVNKWLEIGISSFRQSYLYTPEDEISVFDMNEFRYQVSYETRNIALLIPKSITSKSSIKSNEIDHPVIQDSVLLSQRTPLWIFVKNPSDNIIESVNNLCWRILGKKLPIVISKNQFWKFQILNQ